MTVAETQKDIGIIERVDFTGAGQSSGETILRLKPASSDVIGFVIEMDTPRKKYFRLFEAALTAMWDTRMVEVTSLPWVNLRKISKIRVLPQDLEKTA